MHFCRLCDWQTRAVISMTSHTVRPEQISLWRPQVSELIHCLCEHNLGPAQYRKYRKPCTSVFAYIVIVQKLKKKKTISVTSWTENHGMDFSNLFLSICFSEHDDFGGETTKITPKIISKHFVLNENYFLICGFSWNKYHLSCDNSSSMTIYLL